MMFRIISLVCLVHFGSTLKLISSPNFESERELLVDPIESAASSDFGPQAEQINEEKHYEEDHSGLSQGYLPPPPSSINEEHLHSADTFDVREKSLLRPDNTFEAIFNLDFEPHDDFHHDNIGFGKTLNNDFEKSFLEHHDREYENSKLVPTEPEFLANDQISIFDNSATQDFEEPAPEFFSPLASAAEEPVHDFEETFPHEFENDLTAMGSHQHLQFALPEFQNSFGRQNQKNSYQFQYGVNDPHSGNDFSRQESSDGDTVTGEYRVLLPDGRRQIVSYMADENNGYNAIVRYEDGSRTNSQSSGDYEGYSNNHNSLTGPSISTNSFDRLPVAGRFVRPHSQPTRHVHRKSENLHEETISDFGTRFAVGKTVKESYDKEYSSHHHKRSPHFTSHTL